MNNFSLKEQNLQSSENEIQISNENKLLDLNALFDMNQNKISLPIPNSIQNDCSLKRLSKYYNLETKGTKNMRKFKNNKNAERSRCSIDGNCRWETNKRR